MTNSFDPWTRVTSACVDPARVLVLHHVQGDTYMIEEGEEVSLSDRETLVKLIEQLSGKEPT